MPTLYNVDPLEVGQKFSGTKTVYFNTNVVPPKYADDTSANEFLFGFEDAVNQANFYIFNVKLFCTLLVLLAGLPESEVPQEEVYLLALLNEEMATDGIYNPLYISHEFTVTQAIIDAVKKAGNDVDWTPKTIPAGWQVQQVDWTMAGESTAGLSFGSNTSAEQVNTFASWSEFSETPPPLIPDWENSFVKTADGNKAVRKVWIKQNGQLVSVWEAPPSFATDTWEQISAACKDGSYKTVYKVGDTKDITLSTGETITVAIIGFDHDDLSDGSGKAPITVAMKNLLATEYRMNATNTNEGGWNESEMRTSTMATLLSQLPSDLQSVIKEVNKKATAGSKSENITTSADKLWLFAISEIFSATGIENSVRPEIKDYANIYKAEGTQYEYYENLIGDNRGTSSLLIKKLSNGNGSASIWWLRSPSVISIYSFHCINSQGDVLYGNASPLDGVCFGFCIG